MPVFWATHVGTSRILLAAEGLQPAPFSSEEGVQKGDGPAGAEFCAGKHPEVKALDADLAMHGGAARFIMDDGYAVGAPSAVVEAGRRFGKAVAELELEVQVSKCECYCPSGPQAQPAGFSDTCSPLVWHRSVVVRGARGGCGIMIGGVPVGDDGYVHMCLAAKAGEVVSKVEKVHCVLRSLHLQAAHCVTYYCLNTLFQHWTQHRYPDQSIKAASSPDRAVLGAARVCLGHNVAEDRFAIRRLHLPARMYGGRCWSSADAIPEAFIGAICHTMTCMPSQNTLDGAETLGFMLQFDPLVGPH